MSEKNSNLRIAVLMMDPAALMGIKRLIRLDPRVNSEALIGVTEPGKLMKALASASERYDVVIVDAEAYFGAPPQQLDEYLGALKIDRRRTCLVCLANRPDPDLLVNAVKGRAHGLLLKRDVTPGLLHAALRAHEGFFLYSESLRGLVDGQHVIKNTTFELVVGWRPHEELTAYRNDILAAHLLDGESLYDIAQRMGKSRDSVEKALYQAYEKIIDSSWYSEASIKDLKIPLSLQQKAYLYYTALPRSPKQTGDEWQPRRLGRPRKDTLCPVKSTAQRAGAGAARPEGQ